MQKQAASSEDWLYEMVKETDWVRECLRPFGDVFYLIGMWVHSVRYVKVTPGVRSTSTLGTCRAAVNF